MVQFHVGIVLFLHFRHNAAPHARFGQHVRLVDGRYLAAALLRRFEGLAGNAFHFGTGVEVHVGRRFHAVHEGRLIVGAEIDAARQFADDEQVRAGHAVLLQRGQVGRETADLHGTQVAVQTQGFTDAQQAFFGADGRVHMVPFRAADGTEHDGVRRVGSLFRHFRKGVAVGVDGAAAQQLLIVFQGKAELFGCRVHDADRGIHDLRANSVARQQHNLHEWILPYFFNWLLT